MLYKNNIILGVVLSLLVTAFGASLVYLLRYQPLNMSFQEFINDIAYNREKKNAILSLSLLSNIPLLYFMQQRKQWKTLRGISFVIIVFAILIICFKFHLL